MITVGLTGQSGAGKTTVSETFGKNGFFVINADKVAREVMKKGSECLSEVAEAFGSGVLYADGRLNRRKLGGIVFSDKEKLGTLNGITYKYITKAIDEKIAKAPKKKKFILLDAPTLFEAGMNKRCDCIVSVVADESIRLERIVSRDKKTEAEVRARFASQFTTEFFMLNSDYIIANNSTVENAVSNTMSVISQINKRFP